MKWIAFTGGGTGGHIYPGLAVADELRKMLADNDAAGENEEIKFLWIGCNKGMDKSVVEKSGSCDAFAGIPSGKLRRYFSLQNVADVFKIIGGFFAAFFVLLKYKPVVLFSKGGFVSVPPCYAAKLLKIPVFTHECDVTPGLATRLNSKCAEKILLSFEKTQKYFSEDMASRLVVTGDPVRPVFYEADRSAGLKFLGLETEPDKPVLLVLGGSLGAKQINDLVTANLDWLCERFYVVHQTGKAWAEENDIEALKKQHPDYLPYPFIYGEMPHVMAAGDVVLSRAGSNFLWECAVTAKPLVLIPLSGSGTRGDQVDNAALFLEKEAAFVLGGRTVDGAETPVVNDENLKQVLTQLLVSETRKKLAENAHAMIPSEKPAFVIAKMVKQAAKLNCQD
ncbi:MAG: UDP-N-acetylglucosamine--N-acetylmuramyl-(pentapeptide) pyrophosphoryl-undecaprenol N-acetylglucosamine transferase [Treponemataceae bacterium]|nr:UDP-N-acetylglucosamine--N-acetylmuramyl-(pentapeptide) pyrophosphoryl-undecaprenol N-acetylglucosamine transferase [Treponemataceae bacterium]